MEKEEGKVSDINNGDYHALEPAMPVANQVQNEAGMYVPTQFGWLFVSPQEMMPSNDLHAYEQAVNNNANNLAQSENVAKGRVTFAMIDDEPEVVIPEGDHFDVPTKEIERSRKPSKGDSNKKAKAGVSICACIMTTWLAVAYFAIDHLFQVFQYVALAIASSTSWMSGVYDFLKGMEVFTFEVKDEIYISIVIACIAIILVFSLIALLAFCDIVDVDCCEEIEEWVSMIVFEYFFFGFFAIPILKLLLQTYDCHDVGGKSVLERYEDWECGKWKQLLVFVLSMITCIFLISGAIVRNLAREAEMHFRNNKWRFKLHVKYLLIKEMGFKMLILIVAIFGPHEQYWPNLACSLLTIPMILYWLKLCPYVIDKYNHIKVATLFATSWCFFASFIANLGDEISGFEKFGSILLFMFPLAAGAGWVVSTIRHKHVEYDEDEAYEMRHLMKQVDKDSYQERTNIIKIILKHEMVGIRVRNIELVKNDDHPLHGDCKVLDGEFKANGDEGIINLCVLLGILANTLPNEKIYFSKLVILADKEDQATQIPFTHKSSEALIEAYFAGCFRIIKHFQINLFKFDHMQAIKIATFLKDSPTLEVLHLADNQLDHKVVMSIIKRVYDNEALKIINVASNYIYSDNQEEIMKKYNYRKDIELIFA